MPDSVRPRLFHRLLTLSPQRPHTRQKGLRVEESVCVFLCLRLYLCVCMCVRMFFCPPTSGNGAA